MEELYELVFDSEEMEGVYGISLVNSPAIDVMALKFNKEHKPMELKLSSEDKRILVSPVLIPNQKIYRQDILGEGEGYVYVSEKTIEQLQLNFFKEKHNHNSTLEHNPDQPLKNFIFESWIITDNKNDKSTALGFDLPNGTWMVSMKVEDDNLWNEYVKTGEINGVSIDGVLKPIKQENKINFNKNKMKKELFKSMFTKAVQKLKFAEDRKEFKISDELSVYADSDELTVGVEVFKADGEKMVESEFDYNGKLYKVNAEGKIETIEEINADDPQMNFEFSDEEVEAMVEEIKEEIIVDYESEVSDLKARIVELEAKLAIYETAEIEAVELRKQRPASKGVVTKLSNQAPAKGVLGAIKKHLK